MSNLPGLVQDLRSEVEALTSALGKLTKAVRLRTRYLVVTIIVLTVAIAILIGGWINNRALTNRIEQESLLRSHELCMSENESRMVFLDLVNTFVPEERIEDGSSILDQAEELLQPKKCPPADLIAESEGN